MPITQRQIGLEQIVMRIWEVNEMQITQSNNWTETELRKLRVYADGGMFGLSHCGGAESKRRECASDGRSTRDCDPQF
jgi:hypothetical protein